MSHTSLAECHYAKCHYAECHCAECHYAGCRYSECRGFFILPYLKRNRTDKEFEKKVLKRKEKKKEKGLIFGWMVRHQKLGNSKESFVWSEFLILECFFAFLDNPINIFSK